MNTIIEKLINKSSEMINSTALKNENRKSDKNFTRERKMNFKNIIYFCINCLKKSLQIELDDFMELIDEEIEKPITKQAFSKARQHISPQAFESLFLMTSETLFNNTDSKRYKGYRVFTIDGTELELSRSIELAQCYPPIRKHLTAPRARVSIMCDVLSGAIIHADFHSLTVDERTLAINHLNHYKSLSPARNSKDLFIFDRGYPSKNLIEFFEKTILNI